MSYFTSENVLKFKHKIANIKIWVNKEKRCTEEYEKENHEGP